MKRFPVKVLLTGLVLLGTLASVPSPAAAPAPQPSLAQIIEGDRYLPIGLTPEEELMLDRIGEAHRRTAPPSAPVRQPAEFEPMTGVLVRYPFGNPTNLLAEYAEDLTLWVIVANSSERTAAYNELQSGGCNMSHVSFITASTNSIWTRDYGPWFVFTGANVQGIVDHVYNRPRPLDDLIPGVIGSLWGIPVYGMDLYDTGGNYMTDGRGIAMSSRLIIDENVSLTTAQIDSIMLAYCGITHYEKLPYIQTSGIHHIDCWAKLLSPEKLLIRRVPPSHTDYARIEANVAYMSTLTNSYGRPYEIVRVDTPNNEPYTNSIIVNDKVFVPLYGTAWDDDAVATYQAAMPGYEVLGYTGPWASDDAIHCRAMGVTDRYMLAIDHVPASDTPNPVQDYHVAATIVDYSNAGVVSDSVIVYWKTSGAPSFTPIVMTDGPGDLYSADIPAQPVGTEIDYYVFAKDNSGRREKHPYVAPGDVHRFHVVLDATDPVIVHTSISDMLPADWPPTVVAYVTDNTSVASVMLETWINGARQTDATMARVGTTAEYRAVMPGSVGVGDAVNYRIMAVDAAYPANDASHPETGTHYFKIVDAVDVVIWEPDGSPQSGGQLMTILDGMNVSYDYTTTTPAFANYSAAFICLGVYAQNYALSTSQANAIVAYLNAGGRVYMEGGDCWAYDSARTIYNPYFGISGTSDGSADLTTVLGETGTIAAGMSFSYTGANSYIDHTAPLTGALRIFKNPADGAGCGVSKDAGTYRTVGCSFKFAGLVDGAAPSTKAELLSRILEFFGIGATGVADDTGGAKFALFQNRPNPFNPVTTLTFELPAAGTVELAVYSAAGKKVATLVAGELGAGRHTAAWKGVDDAGARVASGVYFFRLTRNGESVARKGVLLK